MSSIMANTLPCTNIILTRGIFFFQSYQLNKEVATCHCSTL